MKKHDPELLAQGIIQGERFALAKGITLLESTLPSDRATAAKLLELVLPHTGRAVRIGITGVPGVGKSSFIESFGLYLVDKGHKLAVLAIDPSSPISGGSLLGDKTRMEELSRKPEVFIRPSPAGKSLGGITAKTRQAILLCEAAGYDTIMVETVGVGQSETAVRQVVDFFLLLLLAGGGDELQGMKRGIMEMADALIINKADGDNIARAKMARMEYQNALHLMPKQASGLQVPALTASSIDRSGFEDVYFLIKKFQQQTKKSGWWQKQRDQQNWQAFLSHVNEGILNRLIEQPFYRELWENAAEKVIGLHQDPDSAAEALISKVIDRLRTGN